MFRRLFPIFLVVALVLSGCAATVSKTAGQSPAPVQTVSIAAADRPQSAAAPSPEPTLCCSDEPLIELLDEAADYRYASANLLEISGGAVRLTVKGQALICDVSLMDEDASFELVVAEDSAFTGQFSGGLPSAFTVRLAESAAWNLTADTNIGAIESADPAFANIHSDGYNVCYVADLTQNAALQNKTFPLPGGGSLTPMI